MQTPASERGNIRTATHTDMKKEIINNRKNEGQGYREVICALDRVSGGGIKKRKDKKKGEGSRGRQIFAADSAGE